MLSISESYPEHPDTIIIKNKFYPSGLKEIDIYNFFMQNKENILNQTRNKELMLFIAVGLNKNVVKRKIKNSFIYLNKSNYEKIINSRVISIHNTMRLTENFGIIDVDYINFDQNKKTVIDIYDTLIQLNKFKYIQIKYTGKTSFHIICYYNFKKQINLIRKDLYNLLKDIFDDKYDLIYGRKKEKTNLDLSLNKFRGGFISMGSLSVWGLKSITIKREEILNFKQQDAKI